MDEREAEAPQVLETAALDEPDGNACSSEAASSNQAELPHNLNDLLELEEVGENVSWPPGWTAGAARRALHERSLNMDRPTKRARQEATEHVSSDGSTPVVASARAPPIVQAALLNPGPAPVAVHEFGRYHDLRLSGVLVSCCLCGRFGAERIQRGR